MGIQGSRDYGDLYQRSVATGRSEVGVWSTLAEYS